MDIKAKQKVWDDGFNSGYDCGKADAKVELKELFDQLLKRIARLEVALIDNTTIPSKPVRIYQRSDDSVGQALAEQSPSREPT